MPTRKFIAAAVFALAALLNVTAPAHAATIDYLGADVSLNFPSNIFSPLTQGVSGILAVNVANLSNLSFAAFSWEGVSPISGTVTITDEIATPLPDALPMFGAALLALAGFAAWSRRSALAAFLVVVIFAACNLFPAIASADQMPDFTALGPAQPTVGGVVTDPNMDSSWARMQQPEPPPVPMPGSRNDPYCCNGGYPVFQQAPPEPSPVGPSPVAGYR